MTAEQKSKLAQGLFFGLLFIYLGNFIQDCSGDYDSVKKGGKAGVIMGSVILAWGLWQCFVKPKTKQ